MSLDSLTMREKEILRLAANGLCNKQIAAASGTSYYTVKNQLHLIFAKLDAQDRTHAVAIAIRQGIID